MKKSLNTKFQGGVKPISNLEIDEAIASYKSNLDNAPSEHSKEFHQNLIDNLLFVRSPTIKATDSIIKAAIKGTIKMIRLCYPSLLNWKEEYRFYQLQTNRSQFSENMINEFGKDVQSISVTCKDGRVRIFDIKIKAFWGYGRQRNRRPKRCVNVYYSLRDSSKKDNPISVEYGANVLNKIYNYDTICR